MRKAVPWVLSSMFLLELPVCSAQICRLSVAGLNRARRVTGPVHAECPAPFTPHTAPFGNWGVSSNFGPKENGRQFDGWCHDSYVCNNIFICQTECKDGWYEWNSCTDDRLFQPPNCSLYNANDCTEQISTTGVNVHGTKLIDLPTACPIDTDGDGMADSGGCGMATGYSPGVNFMSLYELDPGTADELVQTLYFPETPVALDCGVFGCAPAASTWVAPVGYDSPTSPARVHAEMAAVVNWGAFVDDDRICPAATSMLTSVSAASFLGPALAADSIASAFGIGFATDIQGAKALPLPTSLAGVRVEVTDSHGTGRPAPLFYVSPTQINFLVPAGTAPGPATVMVHRGSGIRWTGQSQVEAVAPGLFSANGDGQGVAAAASVLVAADGSQTSQLIFECGAEPASCTPIPVDLGAEAEQVFLLLFGTGLRGRRALPEVSVKVGGIDAEVTYAGPQGYFVGLDQINVRLPRMLIGRGETEIVLSVEGKAANPVTVSIR